MDGATGIKIGNDQQLVVAGYADDVIIMAESEEDLKRTTSKLIEEGGKIGLMVNEEKTKYMLVTRHNHEIRHMKVNNYIFERVANFKYLGVNINENADSLEEIRLRLVAANKCYFRLVPLFKSKLLSWKTKITLYKVLIRPVALYACGAWATTMTDEKRLATFERKVLRRIFGPKRNALGDFELRTNREVEELYGETNIIGVLKSSRLGWAGHVWRSGGPIGLATDWEPDTRRPRGRPRQRWKDRITKDASRLGVNDGKELAQDRDRWRLVVVAAMDLNGP